MYLELSVSQLDSKNIFQHEKQSKQFNMGLVGQPITRPDKIYQINML
jgi:hypothetical protein